MKNAAVYAALVAAALATPAQAQICAGFPAPERGFYFGARADFPEEGDSFGVEAAYNASGPLALFGGLNVVSSEGDEDDESVNVYRVGAAFEVVSLGAFIGPQVSACPTAEVNWASENDVTIMQIPIGLGIGADLGTPMIAIQPYVVPALYITRLDVPDDDPFFEDDSSTDFGVRGGVNVGFGMFSVGGEVQHVFSEGESDPVFGIRVGLRI